MFSSLEDPSDSEARRFKEELEELRAQHNALLKHVALVNVASLPKLEWLARQCRSPRPRLGTLTLAAMADVALAVQRWRIVDERLAIEEGHDPVTRQAALAVVAHALLELDQSIGGGDDNP